MFHDQENEDTGDEPGAPMTHGAPVPFYKHFLTSVAVQCIIATWRRRLSVCHIDEHCDGQTAVVYSVLSLKVYSLKAEMVTLVLGSPLISNLKAD